MDTESAFLQRAKADLAATERRHVTERLRAGRYRARARRLEEGATPRPADDQSLQARPPDDPP